jgi:type IV pilus assembly protein PilA
VLEVKSMSTKKKKKKVNSKKGFTLIELLVVVAIVGILAAIAIPQFQRYRERAFNARAQSDLRNLMTAQEAHFVDNEAYTDDLAALGSYGFRPSNGVTVTITSASSSAWAAFAEHPSGTQRYCYNSAGSANGIEGVALGAACP